jgi:type IV pilus assembly protein PilM
MARSLRTAARNRTVVGLDIEPGAIAAAEVTVNGRVTVQRAGSLDLPPDVVRDGEVVDIEALADALKELWAQHKGLDRKVRVGIANARIVVRTVDVPNVADPKDLAAAVRFVAADELPMPLDSAVLDFEPVGVVETPDGPRMRVVLVAARREMVETVLAAVYRAGLKPQGVDLSAFAMIRALGAAREGTALYLSVGGLTNLAVSADGVCLFARVTGGGLEAMAIELAERRSLTLEHARMWLKHVGLETPVDEIEGDEEIVADARVVLTDGTRRLAGEVRASLDFHQGQAVAGAPVQGALLTGAATGIAGFAAALEAELGLPLEVRTVEAATHVEDVNLARVTVAAGLAVEEVGP